MTFKLFIENTLVGMINSLIPVIFLLAFVTFMYGIVLYIARSGDEGKRKDGIRYMTYGVIGLAVMLGVWGIVELLALSLFGVSVWIPQF